MLIESTNNNDRSDRYKQKLYQHLSGTEYRRKLADILTDEIKYPRIEINLDKLRNEDPELADSCIDTPLELTQITEQVIAEIIREHQLADNIPNENKKVRICFEGNFGKHTVTPRGLKSSLVNKLVKIQGIVISASKVRPRLLQSTHFCEKNNTFLTYQYDDPMKLRVTENNDENFKEQVPIYDNENNPIMMEFGLCEYKDVQILTVQEMPENVPTGLLSRSIEVMLQEDLVDTVKPGDRVQVVGVLRPASSGQTYTIGVFRTTLMATSVTTLASINESMLTPQELKDINAISKREDLLQLFMRSVAPSIAGNDAIKEALLLLLLGGNERNLNSGTRLRGDINVLLVGDPSTGKSQFLRRIMTLANLAFSTTGRGSSGVGLTAAVTIDKDTKERQLEAGAMVLADRGIICIDEFDKMSVEDRVAMHEVMEQQTVTIAKAGIHVSLNARCSVLAAANPLYGEYIKNRSASVNINLPDSLLSRFDLIFIVIDDHDSDHDRVIAQRVTNNHRFNGVSLLNSNYHDGSGLIEPMLLEETVGSIRPFEQFNPLIDDNRKHEYLTLAFMKKYLTHAKKKTPKLSPLASQYISAKWAQMRDVDHSDDFKDKNRILPITIRSLESLIRISTAYAKLRLANEVDIYDCVNAFKIFLKAFYGGVEKFDPSFFRDLEVEYGIRFGSTSEKKPRASRSRRAQNKEQSNTQMEIETPTPKPQEGESTSRRRTRQSSNQQNKNTSITTLDATTKSLFAVLLSYQNEMKSTVKRNNVEVKIFLQYVKDNFPNSKHPELVIDNDQQFHKLLENLVNTNKIVLDEDFIFII